MNRIEIELPQVENNTIKYKYKVIGEWQEAFRQDSFFIEYSHDIAMVPAGVLMVPFLANILPMSWVYDAEIVAPVCDKDFFYSIDDFKRGYIEMFPMVDFGGKLYVSNIQNNRLDTQDGTAAFFSGGVDAFCTLIRHRHEKPTLLTIWGSDISLEDQVGWGRVEKHLKEACETFATDCVVIKSQFRKFLNAGVLSNKVKNCGDNWWHGFQHGIGIISHAAPVTYALGKKSVYIASSFTVADKGKITCASDPTIDNYVRFSGTTVIHDGYELTRQDKIQIITQFSRENGIQVPLRVCWESKGGSNCCHCEKCWRTILGIYATGANPNEFGFDYPSLEEVGREIKRNRKKIGTYKEALYKPIWISIRNKYSLRTINPGLRWFYLSKFSELETGTKFERMWCRIKKPVWKVKRKLKSWFRSE